MQTKNKRGFTLIELLVVIAIIALLSTIVIRVSNTARANARDARRINDIRQIQNALELFYSENGFYPASQKDISYSDCVSDNNDYDGSFDYEYNYCNAEAANVISSGNNDSWGFWDIIYDGQGNSWYGGCYNYSGCGTNDSNTWNGLINTLSKYNKNIPKDPKNTLYGFGPPRNTATGYSDYNYVYIVSGDGKKYELMTTLETTKKSDCGNSNVNTQAYRATIGAVDNSYSMQTYNSNVNYCKNAPGGNLNFSDRLYMVKNR